MLKEQFEFYLIGVARQVVLYSEKVTGKKKHEETQKRAASRRRCCCLLSRAH